MEEQSNATLTGSDGFSSVLSGILSNPEMMSMISSMAGKLKGDSAETSADEVRTAESAESATAEPPAPSETTKLPEAISALAPLLSGEGAKLSKRDNDRACLLRALKPYLSPGRSEAIDYIIKFSSIAEVLKSLS